MLEANAIPKTPAYSSADSWKPPIHVSDWLIFCCGNLILYQKKKKRKRNEKQQKCQKSTSKH